MGVEEMDVMAGDYPKLPVKSAMIHLRDPFYPWDVPTLRRNFGEPLQENWNSSKKIGSPTWTELPDTPGSRWLPHRLPGSALSSFPCGFAMESMVSHCWSGQWRVSS